MNMHLWYFLKKLSPILSLLTWCQERFAFLALDFHITLSLSLCFCFNFLFLSHFNCTTCLRLSIAILHAKSDLQEGRDSTSSPVVCIVYSYLLWLGVFWINLKTMVIIDVTRVSKHQGQWCFDSVTLALLYGFEKTFLCTCLHARDCLVFVGLLNTDQLFLNCSQPSWLRSVCTSWDPTIWYQQMPRLCFLWKDLHLQAVLAEAYSDIQ